MITFQLEWQRGEKKTSTMTAAVTSVKTGQIRHTRIH